jgi:glycosyltransferase
MIPDIPPLPQIPRVTLITACFNSVATIGRTLESVAAQVGGFELEHVIQDGGSTDGTVERVAEYTRTARHRVAPVSAKDAGFYDAINRGVARATGDVIGLINADDWLADEQVLRDVVGLFLAEAAIDAVYADLDYVRIEAGGQAETDIRKGGTRCPHRVPDRTLANQPDGDIGLHREMGHEGWWVPPPHRVVRHWVAGRQGKSSFRNGWMPPHPTVYVRRAVYERVGGYRLDLGTAADYEWMVRAFEQHRIRAAYLPRVTVKMLDGGQSNVTWHARLLANRSDRRAWSLNGLTPAPWFAVAKPLRKLPQFLGW